MPRWVRIAKESECPPGGSLECIAEDRIVALYNIEGTYYALDGICPHQGGPLGKGKLNGQVVTCPWHGFQFDVSTGKHCSLPNLRQPQFPVRVEEGAVFVALDDVPS
jgi:nitrite reductase (NADH) small subunit